MYIDDVNGFGIMREQSIVGVGLDAGIVNFGVSVIQADAENPLRRYGVKYCAMVPKDCLVTTWSWTEMSGQITRYADYLRSLLDYTPDYVFAERFQTRGFLKSSAGEHVGIMLGIALETFAAHGVEVVMATPGVWKAKYRKQLPSMYNATRADIRLQCKRWSRLPTSFVKSAQENAVHCVDATAMAMSYHMGKKDGAPSGLPLKVSRRLLRGMISQ